MNCQPHIHISKDRDLQASGRLVVQGKPHPLGENPWATGRVNGGVSMSWRPAFRIITGSSEPETHFQCCRVPTCCDCGTILLVSHFTEERREKRIWFCADIRLSDFFLMTRCLEMVTQSPSQSLIGQLSCGFAGPKVEREVDQDAIKKVYRTGRKAAEAPSHR